MLTYASFSWQGSAHTGPALTPVEVLVAIHDVDFAKHGIPLKKACHRVKFIHTHIYGKRVPKVSL